MKQNLTEAIWTPPLRNAAQGQDGRGLWLDNEVIPGAFYVETVRTYPRSENGPLDKYPQVIANKHTYDFDKVLGFLAPIRKTLLILKLK
jgi:hypothetical protein